MRRALHGLIASPSLAPDAFPVTAIDLAYVVAGSAPLALAAARIESQWALAEASRLRVMRTPGVPLRVPGPLRVGYISSDLRLHAVGLAMRGVLQHHALGPVFLYPLQPHAPGDSVAAQLMRAPSVAGVRPLHQVH